MTMPNPPLPGKTKHDIDKMLLDGLNSGESAVVGARYWKAKKNNLKAKVAADDALLEAVGAVSEPAASR